MNLSLKMAIEEIQNAARAEGAKSRDGDILAVESAVKDRYESAIFKMIGDWRTLQKQYRKLMDSLQKALRDDGTHIWIDNVLTERKSASTECERYALKANELECRITDALSFIRAINPDFRESDAK